MDDPASPQFSTIPAPALYATLFVAGLAAGFVDAIAGGGGLITVPVLLWAGLPPQTTLGTNKLQSSCGTALAAWRYGRAGMLSWRELARGLAITFVFAALGAFAVTMLDPQFLQQSIPALLAIIALWMWSKPELGAERRSARMSARMFGLVFGVILGAYDGFFGPGAGSFWMVACVGLLGLDLAAATGHTKAMNLASNLGSLVIFMPKGSVRYDVAAAMIAGQLVGARLGSGLVIARGSRFVRPVFLAVVLVLAARLLWQNARG